MNKFVQGDGVMPGAGPREIPVTGGKTYWWCACGRSRSQPFCDGSHKGTGFTPVKFQATETGTVTFCLCKQTRKPPFCDGPRDACTTRPAAAGAGSNGG